MLAGCFVMRFEKFVVLGTDEKSQGTVCSITNSLRSGSWQTPVRVNDEEIITQDGVETFCQSLQF